MNNTQPHTIVIIGGGIAGSALAILLVRAGRNVWIVDQPIKLDILVGESLLPATIPILQELGVEEEMKAFSMFKPGVAFIMRNRRPLAFNLARLKGVTCTYSYNVPRPQFDEMLRSKAIQEGVRVVHHRVRVSADHDRVQLDAATLEACGLSNQPDLVVDCSGRALLLRRALGLGGKAGSRRDTCLFAHYRNVDLGFATPGFAVMTVMNAGWCWRIPLPGRMSIGVIVETERLKSYGATPAERLEYALRNDPIMAEATASAERITDVKIFNNYQWITERFFGENWAIVGDSAGFVDPALSSGVLLALDGAVKLAQVITQTEQNQREAMARWERAYREHIAAWQEFADYYYDGRLFSMIMQGESFEAKKWLYLLNRHMEKNFAGAVLGARTLSPYSRRLIRFSIQKAIRDFQPGDWAVI